MKTCIFFIIITIILTGVQTIFGEECVLLENKEIQTIQTVVKLPEGKILIINRQIRAPNNSLMTNTFAVEKVIKRDDKLELQISSVISNNITITRLKDNCSSNGSEIKISIDPNQRKTIIFDISVDDTDRVILLFSTDKGEKLMKKLF